MPLSGAPSFARTNLGFAERRLRFLPALPADQALNSLDTRYRFLLLENEWLFRRLAL